MDQLKQLLTALTMRQRIGIAVMALLVAGGVTGFVKWKHERDFKPLFTGMAPEDAAAIVQKLKEGGTDHRIGDNGTSVLVPESKVNELRLEMAGEGLPKTGRIGFELFDKTNLGITDFTEHVNYRRALEGELERSIKGLSEVDSARVHVTFPKDSVFLDSREPAKASILLSLKPGVHLTPQNVQAVTNLVASAVEGLTPDQVSVLDMQGNLLNRPRKNALDGSDLSDTHLEYQHQVEKDLMSKVEATLEPLLGEGKFRVGVSADCDFTTTEQSEEAFDPTKSVMVSSQKTEDLAGASQAAGVPGTASNLPRPASRPAIGGSSTSRRTENVAFETSRVVKNVKIPQGMLKRISASLLIDQEVKWEMKDKKMQRTLVPPPAEKLKAIHDVVAGVLGLVPDRGDQLVIETLPFEQTLESEPPVADPSKQPNAPKTSLDALLMDRRVQIGAGSLLLVLILAVVFLGLRKTKPAQVSTPVAIAASSSNAAAALEEAKRLEEEQLAAIEAQSYKLPLPQPTKKVEVLKQHLKDVVRKDPALTAGILRGWLEEDRK
jgi:flagellar M-ring protein FliF